MLPVIPFGSCQARRKVAEALREVIRKRKEEKSRNDDDDDDKEGQGRRKKDMVAELLEAEEFLEEEMVDFLLALLVAGYETTPTIMTLAVKFVTDNPPALSLLVVSDRIHQHHRIGCTLSFSPSGDAQVFMLQSRESK